jgi:hypothetical protein
MFSVKLGSPATSQLARDGQLSALQIAMAARLMHEEKSAAQTPSKPG